MIRWPGRRARALECGLAAIGVAMAPVSLAAGVARPNAAARSTPLERYRMLPDVVVDTAFPISHRPNAQGLYGSNQQGWLRVSFQRSAATSMIGRLIRGDAVGIDSYWPAIDAGFARQLPNGSFASAPVVDGRPSVPEGMPTDAAFFLATTCQAFLLLNQSEFRARYRPRIDALKPQIGRTARWLATPDSIGKMLSVDSHSINRLFIDAKAMALCGMLIGEPRVTNAGKALLQKGLAMQTSDGVFQEHRGGDTSYQAVSILQIAEIGLFLNDPRIAQVLKPAIAWELRHVATSGEVCAKGNTRTGGSETFLGRVKTVNYPEVVRSFATVALITSDSKALQAARSVASYYDRSSAAPERSC